MVANVSNVLQRDRFPPFIHFPPVVSVCLGTDLLIKQNHSGGTHNLHWGVSDLKITLHAVLTCPAARSRRWIELSLEEQRAYVMRLLDALEVTDRDKRLKVARAILYLAQGVWDKHHTVTHIVWSYIEKPRNVLTRVNKVI